MKALSEPGFVADHWLPRRPAVVRGAAAATELVGLDAAGVFALCEPPVFADINLAGADGANVRRRVDAIGRVPLLHQRYANRGRNLIFYLFRLGAIDGRFDRLRDATLRDFDYRFLSLLCSVAERDSTIEMHADLIDTVIVQLGGRRRWRVDEPCTDSAYLSYLHDKVGDKPALPNAGAPVLDVVLEPGDVLYVPAPWPHGATTVGLDGASVSLSIGFVAITLLRALRLAGAAVPVDAMTAEQRQVLWAPLPDPAPGIDAAAFVADTAWSRAPDRVRAGLDSAALVRAIGTLDPVALAGLNMPPGGR